MRATAIVGAVMLAASAASATTIGFEEVDFSSCLPYCTEEVVIDGYIFDAFDAFEPFNSSGSFEGGNGTLGIIGGGLSIKRVDGLAFSLDRMVGFFAPFEDLQSSYFFVMAGSLGHHNPVSVSTSAENGFSFDAAGPFTDGAISHLLTYFNFSVVGSTGNLVLDKVVLTAAPVPLPATAGLLMAGLVGLGLMRRQRV